MRSPSLQPLPPLSSRCSSQPCIIAPDCVQAIFYAVNSQMRSHSNFVCSYALIEPTAENVVLSLQARHTVLRLLLILLHCLAGRFILQLLRPSEVQQPLHAHMSLESSCLILLREPDLSATPLCPFSSRRAKNLKTSWSSFLVG